MVNISGNIIMNGVTDKQMELIWGYKAKHEGAFSFTPNVIQTNVTPQGTVYNNVTFGYTKLHGLNLITEIVNELSREESKAVGL